MKYLIIFLGLFIPSFGLTFDGYEAYPKDDKNTFGYDVRQVCKIHSYAEGSFAELEDVFTIAKSAPSKFSSNVVEPLACFYFRGYAYIFYRSHETKELVNVQRGKITKSFLFSLPFSFHFDHYTGQLYASSKASLFKFELTHFSRYFLHHNFPHKLDNMSAFFILINISVPSTDLLVFNKTVYFINSGIVNKIQIDNPSHREDGIIGTKEEKFRAIPFRMVRPLLDHIENVHRISDNQIVLTLPPIPDINTNGPGISVLIYILTFGSIIGFFWFLRLKFTLNTERVLDRLETQHNFPLITPVVAAKVTHIAEDVEVRG